MQTRHTTASVSVWQRAVSWALRGVLATWVVMVLAWGALHVFILPRIVAQPDWLEQQATRAVGLRMQLGEVQLAGGWWMPWLTFQDVRVFDAQQREALRLKDVTLVFSPWSLLRGGFEQVVLDQPELDIRRDAQGHVWVAGVSVQGQDDDTALADWFFSQHQFLIRQGTVHWRDELKHGPQAPELSLAKVDVTLLNGWRSHALRLDGTPPSAVGERLSLRGQFEQPLWARAGDWQQWRGQFYAHLPYTDVSQLRQWINLDQGMSLQEGRGALHAWVDVIEGMPVGVTADVTLDAVHVKLGADLQPLRLKRLQGRVGAKWQSSAYEVSSQDLSFETAEGERWPGGQVRVTWLGDDARTGSVQVDRLDLDALSRVAQRLPLPHTVGEALSALQPKGQANQLQISWQRPLDPKDTAWQYTAKGQLVQLSLQHAAHKNAWWAHWPGVENAQIDFEANQQKGKAKISLQNGSVTLPMGLDEARIPLSQASLQGTWQVGASDMQVNISQASLSNEDGSGDFSGSWKTGPGQTPYPGVLDLTANFERLQAQRVYRYLPNTLSQSARQYVAQAVLAGVGSKVKLRLKGALNDMPFNDPKLGEFHVVAQVTQGRYAYVPPATKTNTGLAKPWPVLEQIDGELIFDRSALTFKGKTHLSNAPKVGWHKVQVSVPDLHDPVVSVSGEGRGPVRDVLAMVNTSAVGALLDGALDKAQASGEADYSLGLTVPVQQLDKTQIKGQVLFKDSELQVVPGTPVLNRAKGAVLFNQEGFQLKDFKAKALGGDVELQGGLTWATTNSKAPTQLKAQGQFSADGLRQAKELGFVSRLATNATGKSNYQLTLNLKRGQPEWVLSSDLRGMALNLPSPLNKAANIAMPLRVENQLTKESVLPKPKVLQDVLKVSVGRVLGASYLRDIGSTQTRVLSGGVWVGAIDSAPVRDKGVGLNLALPSLDVDAWSEVLSQWTGLPVGVGKASPGKASTPSPMVGASAEANAAMDYVPTSLSVRAEQIKVAGRAIHEVVVGGTLAGELWRLNVRANELSGLVELRPATANTASQLYARLSYLNIPPSLAADMENLLAQQTGNIPALDIVVNELTLRGKKLGRLDIEAVNQGAATANNREWRLHKFNLTVPEATLTAKGDWLADGNNARRTHLNFVLDVRDSGQLLTRLGTPNAVREGRGKMQGQITWRGSPMTLDYASLSGQVNINIEKGQFLKTEPGAARLLGVLNLQALPRRLALDFNDVFKEGFVFDFFRGDARIDQGVAYTNNLQMKGVVAGALIEGRADLARETQDLKVVVVPDINAGTASLYMAAINPLVGLTSYLAQLVLSKPLVKAGTTEYRVDGSWAQPRVTEVN